MFKKEFASSYTSFDSTGATYITQHTKVKLVGIDYLSIGCLEDIVETHRVLLGKVGLTLMHRNPSTAAKSLGELECAHMCA
jgi:kynurenine formamidase